jgi:hypothetical protein
MNAPFLKEGMNPPAATTCRDCMRGPSGIAGHDALFSQTMSPDEMHFRCRACQQAWARRHEAANSYYWARIARVAGTDTPGRPGTTPP